MKMKIFIFIILLLIPISVFSQEINKMLNSNIAIELWTGEKIYGKVIKVDLSSITIDKRSGFSISKPNEQTFLFSGIKRIYNEEDKIVYEGKKFKNVIYIKRYKNLELILPCIFTGAVSVNHYFKYSDKMSAAEELGEGLLAEELRKDATRNMTRCVTWGGVTVAFYIAAMRTETIEIPISNLSLEIKLNKINLSYKF